MTVPRDLIVYQCAACNRRYEQASDRPIPPQCGHTVTERIEMGSGNWTEITAHSSHGAMTPTGETIVGNPFQKLADERAEASRAAG